MKRAIPVLVLTVAGLIPVWRYAPSTDTSSTTEVAEPASAPSTSSSGGASNQVVAGSTIKTEKGPVQVEVTFDGDKISSVRMLQQPNHPQTKAAVPKLIAETLTAQSADIDAVSGATITSEGYVESLQAAIDAKPASSSSSSSPSASAAASQVVAGSAVGTEKGTVQVEVTFEGDKIDAVRMLQQPNHPQTKAAVPKLIAETLEAQSSDIDAVSGATITSEGYVESLQAAIDAKG
ncbi:FMN-binding protein [Streptomyces sp. ActVer]|uniref:FMN-binding protein n=1 Tax=Streptomyces sp. ActVer TaxID=3014558 RepID=UPI0022B32F4E|nr:FMN-binding protein [Streptomyces sp. ActVer]MCZ4507458.1 FMN-binding protein [Streptomyces sp. ActVer]